MVRAKIAIILIKIPSNQTGSFDKCHVVCSLFLRKKARAHLACPECMSEPYSTCRSIVLQCINVERL